MNVGVVRLHRGFVLQGMQRLAVARRVAKHWDYRSLIARIDGWLGLGWHLAGDFEKAHAHYCKAIRGAKRSANTRALSIFATLRGNLYRGWKRFSEARDSIRLALMAAEGGRHPDLRAQTLLAKVWLEAKDAGQGGGANTFERLYRIVDETDGLACRLGSTWLETDVLLIRARLHLVTGNLGAAWSQIRELLALTRSHGMQLRFLNSLVLAGEVALKMGRKVGGESILRTARARAEEVGYSLAAMRARRLLSDRSPEP